MTALLFWLAAVNGAYASAELTADRCEYTYDASNNGGAYVHVTTDIGVVRIEYDGRPLPTCVRGMAPTAPCGDR